MKLPRQDELRASLGDRYRLFDGTIVRVLAISDCPPEDRPLHCETEDGDIERFGPWLCNIGELL